jgi:hypothetical protein
LHEINWPQLQVANEFVVYPALVSEVSRSYFISTVAYFMRIVSN